MPKRAPPEADAYVSLPFVPRNPGASKSAKLASSGWQDFMARFRALPPEEAMMWDAATKGMAFIVPCEMVATCRDAANVFEKGNSLSPSTGLDGQ